MGLPTKPLPKHPSASRSTPNPKNTESRNKPSTFIIKADILHYTQLQKIRFSLYTRRVINTRNARFSLSTAGVKCPDKDIQAEKLSEQLQRLLPSIAASERAVLLKFNGVLTAVRLPADIITENGEFLIIPAKGKICSLERVTAHTG